MTTVNLNQHTFNPAGGEPSLLDLFQERLTGKPYCTDELGSLFIREKKQAIKRMKGFIRRELLFLLLTVGIFVFFGCENGGSPSSSDTEHPNSGFSDGGIFIFNADNVSAWLNIDP